MQENLNRIFGFCTVLYGGLLGYETVSTGSFDACAVRYYFTLFLRYPDLYSALATAYSSAAAPSLLHALPLQCHQVMSLVVVLIQSQPCPPIFEKGTLLSMGNPTRITVG